MFQLSLPFYIYVLVFVNSRTYLSRELDVPSARFEIMQRDLRNRLRLATWRI